MNPKKVGWIFALRHTPLHPQWLLPARSAVLRMVLAGSKGIVLDIGCADRWVERALPASCSYIGLDYPATGGELYGARPDCFGDALSLPCRDGSIDTVLLLDVLEHLSDPERALAEIYRVLSPRGNLIVSVPFLYPIHDAPYDFQRFTAYGLTRAMTRCGLAVSQTEAYSRSSEVTGLFAALWIAGVTLQCWQKNKLALVLAVPMLPLIPVINIAAWIAARLLPDWPAIYGGVNIIARKEG